LEKCEKALAGDTVKRGPRGLLGSSILKEIEEDIGGGGNVKVNVKNLKSSDEGSAVGMELGMYDVHHIQNIFFKPQQRKESTKFGKECFIKKAKWLLILAIFADRFFRSAGYDNDMYFHTKTNQGLGMAKTLNAFNRGKNKRFMKNIAFSPWI